MLERTLTPGATTSGLRAPLKHEGPRLLKPAIVSFDALIAPTPIKKGYEPGAPTVPAPGPALPLENEGMMPASIQAWIMSQLSVLTHSLSPQELVTIRGRRSGRRFCLLRSQGASMKSSAVVISSLPDEPPAGKTFAEMNF